MKRISHWVNGGVVVGTSGRSGPVWNPATGEQQAEVDFASAEEVDHAVATAREAFASWRATSLSRRAEVLFHLRELVDAKPVMGVEAEERSLLRREEGDGRLHGVAERGPEALAEERELHTDLRRASLEHGGVGDEIRIERGKRGRDHAVKAGGSFVVHVHLSGNQPLTRSAGVPPVTLEQNITLLGHCAEGKSPENGHYTQNPRVVGQKELTVNC